MIVLWWFDRSLQSLQ